ncbi:acyltransferase [Aggregicoccus sp. 17bor-14]|uniref:acyltransferase family protein n=1 Tax=Myxococcaceae TaxID=31 RepID=UPI00129C363E|nr:MULTISPECIES: acyltransferase [Myxococcaceae]MBF5043337.1 acyltransferase [Simulacricoccus sp. 17bor-14]MRI89096.1 acyltransferase [Aggregicoccus sp. 17bor-14]
MTAHTADTRRPDLDWLRVFCIAVLLAYHVGMFFVTWDWHLKNPQLLPVLEPVMDVLHVVRMPLLMLVSGAGTAFALRRRSLGAFARDRVKRLGVPVLFGILAVVPPQIYVERVYKGQFHGSFLAFWPSVLRGQAYPAGNTSWHHLWFVAYLLTYCLLALPLFAWLGRAAGRAALARLERGLARPGALLLLFLPLAALRIALRRYPETHALFDDPKLWSSYGYLFLVGHLLGRMPGLFDRLAAQRHLHLGAFALLLAALLPEAEFPFPFEHLATWAMAWSGMLAALGYARHHVRTARPWLQHAQGLAYPFYIWHQTVILVLAYGLLRWSPALGPWARFALLLAASGGVSWALSEAVARVPLLRPLFGLGPARRRPRPLAEPLPAPAPSA